VLLGVLGLDLPLVPVAVPVPVPVLPLVVLSLPDQLSLALGQSLEWKFL